MRDDDTVRVRDGRRRGYQKPSMINRGHIKRAIKQSLAKVSLKQKNTVLLTFDDGPHPQVTPEVLRLLKEHNARAIFFVVGKRINDAPHLLRTILDEGHALGNHSYAHPVDGQPWLGSYLKDVAQCQDAIRARTGFKPRFFRPPLGTFSFRSIVAPRLLGLTPVLWSVDADDWSLTSTEEASAAADHLVDKLESSPARNDIVLMHDDQPHVVTLLEKILPLLRSQNCDLYTALDAIQ